MLYWPEHDPDEVLDYSVDWTGRIEDDPIATSDWTITPSGTLVKDSDTFADAITTIWLSGGTAGASYILRNRITTEGNRTLDQSITIRVLDR